MKRHSIGLRIWVTWGCIAGLSLSAKGATIVSWGPSSTYVTAAENLNLPTKVTTSGPPYTGVYAYSASAPISPTSGYSGGTFYGGSYITSNTVLSESKWGTAGVLLSDTSGKNYIDYARAGGGTETFTGEAFTAFLKQDFVNGSTSAVSFDNASSISMNVSSVLNVTFSFAILNGNQWYISSASKTSAGTFTITSANILSSMWAPWSPTSGPNGELGAAPTAFTVAGSTFNDIQGAGVFENFATATSINGGFDTFTLNAAVAAVPEPSSKALLGLGAAVGLGLLFRRQRA